MKILVGKTFGIGNSVLAIPMIKALCELGIVSVLIGSTPDDYGAIDVMRCLQQHGYIDKIFVDAVFSQKYDVAVMAIPFDGRWVNGSHFHADRILDGRKRPGNVDRLGFDMWKKHEAEYQMENARELGFMGPMPDSDFVYERESVDQDLVYLGIGYKKDIGGFGLSKHWGNQNFIRFMKETQRIRPMTKFISTGTVGDLIKVGKELLTVMNGPPNYSFPFTTVTTLKDSFRLLSGCRAYIGNDTGMMHVAASLSMPTWGITPYIDLLTKNPPLCENGAMVHAPVEPELMAQIFVNSVWGKT